MRLGRFCMQLLLFCSRGDALLNEEGEAFKKKKNLGGWREDWGGRVMVELVYKRTTKGHFVCRRASSISTCKFLKQ